MSRKLLAFLVRDWRSARSYRLSTLLQAVGFVVPLAGLFFMARLFETVQIAEIEQYGGNYISFILVGIIVTSYSGVALSSFTGALRGAQIRGTLETLLLTRTSLFVMFFGWTLYPLIRATIYVIVFLVGGLLITQTSLADSNIAAAAIVLLLMVVILGSLGLISGAFAVVFKQSDPFTRVLLLASGLLSGTAYPITIFPGWLQVVAKTLPLTHALEGMRLAILSGHSVSDVAFEIGILAAYAGVLLPLGVFIFHSGMRRARLDGSLAHY